MKHYLQFTDLSADEYAYVFARAALIKAKFKAYEKHQPLTDRTLAMIFEKASTRTRVSFEAGMYQLGGSVVHLTTGDSQLGRAEPIEDSARVISRMVDLVMIRTFGQDKIERFAKYSRVPVINGLTNEFHPCQILADLFTFIEHRGQASDPLACLKGRVVAWVGDGNNMANTWLQAAEMLGFKVHVSTPSGYEVDQAVAGLRSNESYMVFANPMEACRGADLVTTDVWTSMGFEAENETRRAAFADWCVDVQMMQLAQSDALFMHCLPAHRGEEVAAEVIDGPQSVVWDEAENRLQHLFGPVEAQVIRWDASKLNPPEPTQADLESFFKANEAEFAVAPRRTVDVVEITASGTTEEAKKQAGEAAFAFTSQFFNLPEGKSRPDFAAAATQAKLAVRTLGPFTPKDNPFQGENDPRLVMAAFSLTSADPVSDFLPSKNGYLVLHLREEQPGRSRTLAEITPEVRSRWQEQARLQMMAQQAKNFSDRANAALAAGQKWEDITKAFALSPEKLPVFAPADEKPLTFPDADRIRPAVTQLEPNRVGGFARTANGGLSVYLVKRDPAPASVVGTTLPKISAQLLNQQIGRAHV